MELLLKLVRPPSHGANRGDADCDCCSGSVSVLSLKLNLSKGFGCTKLFREISMFTPVCEMRDSCQHCVLSCGCCSSDSPAAMAWTRGDMILIDATSGNYTLAKAVKFKCDL